MDALEEMRVAINKFVEDRDWKQFHSPSNLAKSITIEASELLECFQWDDSNFNIEDVKEELADVINYCIQMADVLSIDIKSVVLDKLKSTEKKYPIEKAKGNSKKYTKL